MHNIIISTGSDGTGTVSTIFTANVKEKLSKENIYVLKPVSKANWSNGKSTRVIDLLRIKRQFTITGYIMAEKNSESCNTARKRLYDLFNAGGTDYMWYPVYNTTRIEVSYENLEFDEDPVEDFPANSDTTTLTGAHSSSVTTITVASTTGFPSAGIIVVNNEAMLYTGTTATTFTGVTRGYLNTVATSHANADTVASRDSIFDEAGNVLARYAVTLTVTEATHR